MQRIIGVALGALVTFVVLVVLDATKPDAVTKYATAAIIGAVVSLLWPWVVGFYLARRVSARRKEQLDEKVQAEVQRTLAEERAKAKKES